MFAADDPPSSRPLAGHSLTALLDRVASSEPTPGAGPSAAWASAVAAALVEMVSAVALRKNLPDRAATEQRRVRAAELRERATELADVDVTAYTDVLAILRRRGEPGHARRLRDALANAAGPPAELAAVAAEITRLAADAAAEARGGVRGEAITAAVLAEAVVRAAQRIVDLNLAGARDDPRRALVQGLVRSAGADLERATAV
jgi:formiminotetrahydrofolate cyclodeaminase